MSKDLVTTLLHQSEGDTLDFKRDQYALAGADNATKAELIKDILALANAWKAADAHILIGVEENPSGGKAIVVGVTDHLEDADLQQLVNSKTNRPVRFNHRAVTLDGKSIGVITIAADQDRPLYVQRDFGGLKSGVVKIRRGSSTADASPDEIAEMGAAKVKTYQSTPRIEFGFADTEKRSWLGCSVLVPSIRFLKPAPPPPVPNDVSAAVEEIAAIENQHMQAFRNLHSSLGLFTRREPTPDDLFRWRQEKAQMYALGFWAKNAGDEVLADVTAVIKGSKVAGVVIWDDTTHPSDEHHMPGGGSFRQPATTDVNFTERGDDWMIEVEFGKLQPKFQLFACNLLYLGCLEPVALEWQAQLFSDNLSNPVKVDLKIGIEPFDVDYDEEKTEVLERCRYIGFAQPIAEPE